MKKILPLLLLTPTLANAECTPTPDCASIGYTQTSCETKSLKCPFDTSKLFCVPCDSSFQYDCTGDNIIGGVGSSCGGKYVSCECSGGGAFQDGICISADCTVGMIYYSDKSCSVELDNSKTAIGIVVKDNELVLSLETSGFIPWSSTNIDTPLTNYASFADAKTDLNGKSNTAIIVATHTTDEASNNAAIYCNSYSTEGTNAGDWYLPALGEFYYLYDNYSTINDTWKNKLGNTNIGLLSYGRTSTENSKNYDWCVSVKQYIFEGTASNDKSGDAVSSTCFLPIN